MRSKRLYVIGVLILYAILLEGCKAGGSLGLGSVSPSASPTPSATPSPSPSSSTAPSGPVITLFQVTTSTPTNSTSFSLLSTVAGSYTDYCLLENDTTVSNCTWTSGATPSTFNVSSTNNSKTLSLWVRDADGNVSTRADSTAIDLDTVVPNEPSALVRTSPGSSPAGNTSVTINVDGVSAGDTVKVYSDSSCTQLEGQAVATSTDVDVTISITTDGTYDFYATATDPATNVSNCSSATESYELNRTLSVTITAPSSNISVSTTSYNVTWTTSGFGTLQSSNPYHVTVYDQSGCSGSVLSDGDQSAASYSVTGIVDNAIFSVAVSVTNSLGVTTGPVCSSSITGNAIIAKFKPATAAWYLSMDVDFTNQLAYLGSGGGGYSSVFFDVVDFSTETSPTLFRSIGSGSTPSSSSTYSRGMRLYNGGTRLVVASDGGSLMELYDLTATPRTGTWSMLSQTTGLTNFRKVAKVDPVNSSLTRVYAALRRGAAIIDIAEPAGSTTVVSSNTGYGNCYGNGAVINNTWMLSGCYNSYSDIFLINLSTYAADQTFTLTDAAQWIWESSVSDDGSKIYSGAGTAQFFSYSASATPQVQLVSSFKGLADTGVRDSQWIEENSESHLYTVSGQGNLSMWNATNIAAPTLVSEQPLTGFTGEGYALRVNPTSHRAYAVTSGGEFFIVNTQMLRPATSNPIAMTNPSCTTAQSFVADMTSNSSPSPLSTSCTSNWGTDYDCWNSFETPTARHGWWTPNGTSTGTITIDLGGSENLSTYTITSFDDATEWACYPTAWTLQGSNDNSSWTTLDTKSGETFTGQNVANTYSISTANYRYYKIDVTAHNTCMWSAFGMGRINLCH